MSWSNVVCCDSCGKFFSVKNTLHKHYKKTENPEKGQPEMISEYVQLNIIEGKIISESELKKYDR